jgi:hypothetical protein
MHQPYFAWLVYKHRSEDCISNVCNGVEQLQLTSDLVESKEH